MEQNITIYQLIDAVYQAFEPADLYYGHGTDNAWDEAVMLVIDALNLAHGMTEQEAQQLVKGEQVQMIKELVKQRIEKKIPLPYLTHKAWFANLEFYVNDSVHIPRSPFAEWIIKGFEPWLNPGKVTRVLDLCSGSGSIAIACAYAFPQAEVDAVELCVEAAKVAAINIEKHLLSQRVHLLHGDLFEKVEHHYDLIISNPPYVSEREMKSLPSEYKHEPRMALAAGVQGLDVVDQILHQAAQYLADGGLLAIEVGNTQEIMEVAYPRLPFIWLECEWGGNGVFVLSKEDLKHVG